MAENYYSESDAKLLREMLGKLFEQNQRTEDTNKPFDLKDKHEKVAEELNPKESKSERNSSPEQTDALKELINLQRNNISLSIETNEHLKELNKKKGESETNAWDFLMGIGKDKKEGRNRTKRDEFGRTSGKKRRDGDFGGSSRNKSEFGGSDFGRNYRNDYDLSSNKKEKTFTENIKTGLARAAEVSPAFKIIKDLPTGISKTIDFFKNIPEKRANKQILDTKKDIAKEKSILSALGSKIENEKSETEKEKLREKARNSQEKIKNQTEKMADLLVKKEFKIAAKEDPSRFGKGLKSEDKELLSSDYKKKTMDSMLEDVIGRKSKIDAIIRGDKPQSRQSRKSKSQSFIIDPKTGKPFNATESSSFNEFSNSKNDIGNDPKEKYSTSKLFSGFGERIINGIEAEEKTNINEKTNILDTLVNAKIAYSKGSTPSTFGQYTAGSYFKLENIENSLSNKNTEEGNIPGETSDKKGLLSGLLSGGISGAIMPMITAILPYVGVIAAGIFAVMQVSKLGSAISDFFTSKKDQQNNEIKVKKNTINTLKTRYPGLKEEQYKNIEQDAGKYTKLYKDDIISAGKRRDAAAGILPKKSEVKLETTKKTQETTSQLSSDISKTEVPLQTNKKTFETEIQNQEVFADLIASKMSKVLIDLMSHDIYRYNKRKEMDELGSTVASETWT